jgi:predicted DsbA family dithiol-disulfide isomerase
METPKPRLPVTCFSDYICPFCYVGSQRLLRLRDDYDLLVNWAYVEIHPETPPEGMPIQRLGYDPEQWSGMMQNLEALAESEGITLRPHDFTTNSRKALLLAEAAKEVGREPFYALHEALFAAFHTEGRNIGDEAVLREIAANCGLPPDACDRAWTEDTVEKRLRRALAAAREIHLQGVPTYVVGRRSLRGVIEPEVLAAAASEAVAEAQS